MKETSDESRLAAAVASVSPEVRALPVYTLEKAADVEPRFKLDQNESPWEPPERVKRRVAREIREAPWALYPEFHADTLREALSRHHDWPADGILIGNGSKELLALSVETFTGSSCALLSAQPCFGLYPLYAVRAKAEALFLGPRDDLALPVDALIEEARRRPDRPVLLASPNNPTGEALAPERIAELAAALSAPLLLDAAYSELCDHDYRPLLDEHPNLVLFRTFSKAWALGGLRVGYLLARPELVAELLKVKLPYNVGRMTVVAALATLREERVVRRRMKVLRKRREEWAEMLRELGGAGGDRGFEVFPSEANFVLVRLPDPESADRIDRIGAARALHRGLAERGVLVRDVGGGPGLDGCLRITIGTQPAYRALKKALRNIFREMGKRGDES
jgi:histidinol-phosphate aminotransferase